MAKKSDETLERERLAAGKDIPRTREVVDPATGEVYVHRIPEQEYRFPNGQRGERLDPTPMAPPVGFVKQPSMFEQMRAMMRQEHLRLALEAEGLESPDEADDFDVDDDFDPRSPFEEIYDPAPRDLAPLTAVEQLDPERIARRVESDKKQKADKAAKQKAAPAAPEAAPAASPAQAAPPVPAPPASGS